KASTVSGRRSVMQMWESMQKWPMGRQLFSLAVGRQARYTGTIGAMVLELSPGQSKVEMRDKPLVRNHLKSVHAIALMNLGELTTGLAVMSHVDGRGRGIVTGLRMEYLKKARGTITGVCTASVPQEAGDHGLTVEGDLLDAEGDVVARCFADWKIQINPQTPAV
ncbi:MAG TPA: DUF4442 domain-containing protein, partial [Planctomycetes bacterium]|nr:DUF4442 domain-containing protein [Planctomycetota bacterium]